MTPIDLRSDTVTRPTPEMYEAIRTAMLGDDVLGDDPTVNELERVAAERLGKEAALFVPSGTMGNQIALACHTRPGDAILVEEEAHIIYYEVGASAMLANVVTWTLPSHLGAMAPETVEKRLLKADLHTPGTTLLCVENTHNRAGGTIIPLETLAEYRALADKNGLKIHMDGARVFNAAVALGVPVAEIAQHCDSVNFCLSKGLRSPVGSILTGPTEFIDRARIWRKRLGGGMRQAGILAACGLVSLNQMVDRLADDHANAKLIANAIQEMPGLSVNMESVQTNIVLVYTERPSDWWHLQLEERGLRCNIVASNRLRLNFHADVDQSMTKQAVDIFKAISREVQLDS